MFEYRGFVTVQNVWEVHDIALAIGLTFAGLALFFMCLFAMISIEGQQEWSQRRGGSQGGKQEKPDRKDHTDEADQRGIAHDLARESSGKHASQVRNELQYIFSLGFSTGRENSNNDSITNELQREAQELKILSNELKNIKPQANDDLIGLTKYIKKQEMLKQRVAEFKKKV